MQMSPAYERKNVYVVQMVSIKYFPFHYNGICYFSANVNINVWQVPVQILVTSTLVVLTHILLTTMTACILEKSSKANKCSI